MSVCRVGFHIPIKSFRSLAIRFISKELNECFHLAQAFSTRVANIRERLSIVNLNDNEMTSHALGPLAFWPNPSKSFRFLVMGSR